MTLWHEACLLMVGRRGTSLHKIPITPRLEVNMPVMSQPAFGPKLSIGFITGGSLLTVWTLVWRYTKSQGALTDDQQFYFWGVLLSGLTFFVIGAFLGSIGRAARKAELPPDHESLRAEVAAQMNAPMPQNRPVVTDGMPSGAVPSSRPQMANQMPPTATAPPTVRHG